MLHIPILFNEMTVAILIWLLYFCSYTTYIWMFEFSLVVSRYTSWRNAYQQVSHRWWCWLPVGIHQQNKDYYGACRLCPTSTFYYDCFRGDWRGKSRWQGQCVRAGFFNRKCRSYFIDWKATSRLCHHWRSLHAVVDYSLESGGLQTTHEERRHRSCWERRPISIRRATVNQRLRSQKRIKKQDERSIELKNGLDQLAQSSSAEDTDSSSSITSTTSTSTTHSSDGTSSSTNWSKTLISTSWAFFLTLIIEQY